MQNSVTILGVNGRIGQYAARAFLAAGWQVTGFGRENRIDLPGMGFYKGNADSVEDIRAACSGSAVVVNALNLPYDKWENGRYEAQMRTVLAALRGSGKTVLYAGNIYNYGAKQHVITPDTPQQPAREKGRIRKRLEEMLAEATVTDNLQVLIVRAPDFFGPDVEGTVFDYALPGKLQLGHSWAYLPDLGRAFVRVAEVRASLPRFEALLFRGYFVTGQQMVDTIQRALPKKLSVRPLPWWLLRLMGIGMPVVRELVKMRYLWEEPHELRDDHLDAILGPDFATPFEEAVAATVRSCLPPSAVHDAGNVSAAAA